MKPSFCAFAVTLWLAGISASDAAFAQKAGGILKMYSLDSPASMSIHEEITNVAEGPMMGVFNNLVLFDQHVKQNSLQSIVPDLAIGWAWSEDGTELQLQLWQDVPYIPMGEYWQSTAYRKDLLDVLPGCFAVFWGIRRA